MEKGPQTEKEWEQYSSHNIEIFQKLPMTELYAMGEILKGIVSEYSAAKYSEELPEEEKRFADLMLEVSRKRLDIVTVAKFKKMEKIFKVPKFK